MELVPKVPSERHIRTLHRVSTLLVVALAIVTAATRRDIWVLPLGAGYTFVLWLAIRRRDIEIENAMDRLECTAMLSARNVAVAALCTFIFGAPFARDFALLTVAWVLALIVHALLRDRERARFLERVYAGDASDLHVVRDTEVRGFELLPSVLSGTLTDAVIAHTSTTHDYRTSHGPRALARVPRSFVKMRSRFAARRRGAIVVAVGVVCSAIVAVSAPLRSATPVYARTPPIAAPACSEAVAYFEERLQSIPGVGRATVIVHGGSGDVVYVPRRGFQATPDLDAIVLESARSIPCSDKLSLSLAQPRYVAFDVSAELTASDGADEVAVQRDAEEQVRALFQPDAHALDNEHFGFGVSEKTFGYRVRHALRHVSGVKSVKLVVNGDDREAPLEPTDYPTLKSLSIGVVR